MSARPFIVAALILGGLPLGCGGRVEMALVDPAKYDFHTCPQLERAMKTLAERARELTALQRKAAGAVIATIAYKPDYLATIGDMRVVETAARDKQCDPPIAIPADTLER
ncbi:MAG: twin-arginine translocation pathway signal [Rhizobiales bacterium]|nr:twin-arginine translocation pathway signal [Hyphomicrobiales bacterium]